MNVHPLPRRPREQSSPNVDPISSGPLARLSRSDRSLLLARATRVELSFAQPLIVEGDVGPLFLLLEGRVRVISRGENHRESVLATLGPGDVFGGVSTLRGDVASVSFRAASNVVALAVGRAELTAVIAARPMISVALAEHAREWQTFAFLRQHSPFAQVEAPVLTRIARSLSSVEVPKGLAALRASDPPGPMYIVAEGRFRVLRKLPDGAVTPVAFLGCGDVFGATALFRNEPQAETVEALTNAKLFTLAPTELRSLLARSSEIVSIVRDLSDVEGARANGPEAPPPLDLVVPAVATPPTPAAAVARRSVSEAPPAPTEEHPFATADGLFKNDREKRSVPFVRQVDEADCGVACLAMVCRAFGRKVPLALLRQLARTATDGTSLRNLCRAATEIGLAARSVRISRRNAAKVPTPAILHWDDRHWVVLVSIDEKKAKIADPARGIRDVELTELHRRWNGHTALFDFTDAFLAAPEARGSLRWLLSIVAPYKRVLGLALGLAVVGSGLTMLLPILTQVVVDRVVVDGAADTLGGVVLTMAATFVLLVLAAILRGYMLSFVAVRVDAAALDYLTRRLLALPSRYFRTRRTGDIQRRLDGVRQIRELLVTVGLNGALSIVQVVVALALMALYSHKLLLAYLGLVPIYVVLMFVSRRLLRPLFANLEEVLGRYRSDQLDAIKGIEAVKAAGGEARFRDGLLERFLGASKQQFHADCMSTIYQGGVQATAFLSSVIFLWIGARLAMSGQLSMGGLVAFNSLVAMANAPLGSALALWDRWSIVDVLLDRLRDVFDSEPEQGHDRERLRPVPSLSGAIELRGIGFRPEKDGPAILHGIDLKVPAGRRIAVVGPSGSGKTTLVRILAGLEEPTEGALLFDGIDHRTLNHRDLRAHIGCVLQQDHVFSASILENICLGREPDVDLAMASARLAHAHEFIEKLPLAYDTQIGESGVALSGGQCQRIAIARALYRQPSILLLDEATSALDTTSERAIQDNLATILAGRTAFIIAHRLSTIRDADLIVVLDKGQVVEQGTHDELVARQGIYWTLVRRQVES